MKVVKGTALALAIAIAVLPCGASAQEVIQWQAPAAATGAYSYFPMGTEVQLTTRTELTTKQNHAGDRFYLEVAEPLIYRGQTVVPVGAVAVGEVTRAERNGHFGKKGELGIRLLYVQTPSGPVRLSGRMTRSGMGQEVLSIGGAALISWPMMFIHGTSGRLPADSAITAYLADELRFAPTDEARRAGLAVYPDAGGATTVRPLPARYAPAVLAAKGR